MYINKAFIYGNITRDPEMKALPSGISVTSFGVATNRTWKNKEGVKQESVDFHNVVAFGKPAELIHQYCKKGSPLFVDGRIQTRSWDDKEGKKQYRTEIVVENFQFGPKSGGAGMTTSASAPAKGKTDAPKEELQTIEYPEEDINPDDIPF
ncbi:MAG: single-stranded DNA-binding protein [Candidatus Lloydbacteria bacterium RIFCSPHIGHO2_02_FULL_50_13]|uniref:Single-stranded DNA-binding protein n=1 Tax=Candidatus Lloydbacteria bacterium RIFCSPHIGHO2_02_FULL_50_13 TaxID=1798661 RepID=A0A1G2D004_9BACT|nr:MAG: single-stranded DNA-binding protein [Candidatus Lloydbacteria bacterium RIFCSPHIGHO2_02_FULL_50_13]